MAGIMYYDDDRVQGVELIYNGISERLLIGTNTSTHQYKAVAFDEENAFIGFFGTEGTDRIF